MGDREAVELWGIGKRTAARLASHGVRTVADLARADPTELATWFGPTTGPRLRIGWLAEADRGRWRTEPWVPRSKSRQVTFPHDLADAGEIADQVVRDGPRAVRGDQPPTAGWRPMSA